MAMYEPAPGLKGEPLSFGFSTDGSLISASEVPHYGSVNTISLCDAILGVALVLLGVVLTLKLFFFFPITQIETHVLCPKVAVHYRPP